MRAATGVLFCYVIFCPPAIHCAGPDQPATNRFGPRNPALLVKPNELLERFAQYRIRYYEDTVVELDEGMHRGPAAVIRVIVEKSPAD